MSAACQFADKPMDILKTTDSYNKEKEKEKGKENVFPMVSENSDQRKEEIVKAIISFGGVELLNNMRRKGIGV